MASQVTAPRRSRRLPAAKRATAAAAAVAAVSSMRGLGSVRLRSLGGPLPLCFSGGDSTLRAEYGARWPALLEAMKRPRCYAAWANPFTAEGAAAQVLEAHGYRPLGDNPNFAQIWVPEALDKEPTGASGSSGRKPLPKPPTCESTGLKLYYPLDLASAVPAFALLDALPPGARLRDLKVLDACAAPGGKALVLAGALYADGAQARLVALERDKFRYNRLKQNFDLYLPKSVRYQVQVVKGDATLSQRQGFFDAALVDAPCSSERERLLRTPETEDEPSGSAEPGESEAPVTNEAKDAVLWSEAVAQSNAQRQVSILKGVLRACPKGPIVYSTCALSRLENDNVVDRVLSSPVGLECGTGLVAAQTLAAGKKPQGSLPAGLQVEETLFGRRLLPDQGGWGPIYWSLLRSP